MRKSSILQLMIFSAVFMTLVVGVASCKKEAQQNTIQGNVKTSGSTLSGATVEVYDMPSTRDIPLWETTGSHTNVGFAYNLQAVFDWRTAGNTRRAQVTADGDGNFSIPDLPDGAYVVIARKAHYGWSRPIGTELRGQTSDLGTINLFPEDSIPRGTILTENTTLLSGHHYVVAEDLIVESGVTLTIEPGAVVRVGDRGAISVSGRIVAEGEPDNYIQFTSNQQIQPAASDWDYVYLFEDADPGVFQYCSFQFCDYGIRSTTGGATVQNCYFANIGAQAVDLTGFHAADNDSVLFQRNIIDHIAVGVRVTEIHETGMRIDHNAIFNCSVFAVDLDNIYGGDIYCNWFYNDGRIDTLAGGISGVVQATHLWNVEIHHNEFELSWYGLALGSHVDSTTHIHHNHFSRMNRVLNIGVTYNRSGASYPHFYNNCLVSCTEFFVYIDACQINNVDVSAENNSWGIPIESLPSRLHDRNDDDICPYVNYNPVWPQNCPDEGVGICSD